MRGARVRRHPRVTIAVGRARVPRRIRRTGTAPTRLADTHRKEIEMAYFVTGATGFIGRYLVANLLRRGRPIYVLVRKGSEKKLAAMRKRWGADDKTGHRHRRRPRQAQARRLRGRLEEAQGKGRPLLPSRRHLRPEGERRSAADRQRRRHEEHRALRRRGRCGMLPSRELDRRGRPLRRHVPRGHVRGGRRPRSPVLQDQARLRRGRAPRMQAAVPHLPARVRRRPLEDRRDRQDRRPLLLLQDAAESCATSCRSGCR